MLFTPRPLRLIVAGIMALTMTAHFAARPFTESKPPFDISRLLDVRGWYSVFRVTKTQLLRAALSAGMVREDSRVLVTETADGNLALLMEQMAYHHIAQGTAGGQSWIATFCVVCNSGVTMTPRIDGKTYHFDVAGVYDGVLLMKDIETETLWSHITGEAVHGELAGRQLPVANLLQMDVKQALAMDPTINIALSDRPFVGRTYEPGNPNSEIVPYFIPTLGKEDNRRPRMDPGLGIWTGKIHRFYPLEHIRARGGALMDDIGGRKVLVYVDRDTSIPAALYVGSRKAKSERTGIQLDNGLVVRSGVLLDRTGKRLPVDRPLQIFTRWYGFALTFPGAEISGAK